VGALRIHGEIRQYGLYATYTLDNVYVARCWPQDLTVMQVTGGESFAALVIALLVFLGSGERSPLAMAWGEGHLALVLFAVASIVETLLFYVLIKRAGALFVSMADYISLLAGVLWGILLLGESHALTTWFAIGLICLALYLLTDDATSTGPASPAIGSS
jgi:drug/metabolite transporter (DMT)-like permease